MSTTDQSDFSQKCLANGVMFDALGNPRKRHVRVTLEGTHCVLPPEQVEAFIQQEVEGATEPISHTLTDVYLSEREFKDLPEFNGY